MGCVTAGKKSVDTTGNRRTAELIAPYVSGGGGTTGHTGRRMSTGRKIRVQKELRGGERLGEIALVESGS